MFPRNIFVLLGISAGVLVSSGLDTTLPAGEKAPKKEAALRQRTTDFAAATAGAQETAAAGDDGVQQLSSRLVEAFNSRKSADLDDAGIAHEGCDAIMEVCKSLTGEYPDAKMEFAIDSIRYVGDGLAVENGVRTISSETG